MKASLVVIASLFVSPAYAFENLIVDSTFQYPVVLTGKVTSWSDGQLIGPLQGSNAASQNQNFSGVPNFPTVPNFPMVPNLPAVPSLVAEPNLIPVPNLIATPNLLPVPNPLVSASPLSLGAQTKPPGNFSDSQLGTTSSNAPQQLSNASPTASATQTLGSLHLACVRNYRPMFRQPRRLRKPPQPPARLRRNYCPMFRQSRRLRKPWQPPARLRHNSLPMFRQPRRLRKPWRPPVRLLRNHRPMFRQPRRLRKPW